MRRFICLFAATALMLAGCENKPDGGGEIPAPAEYEIKLTVGTGGTATVTLDGKPVTHVGAGKEILLRAKPDEGKMLVGWTTTTSGVTIGNPTALATTFTMPESDVRLAVAFKISPTSDKGVVINGVKWATRNVNAPGTFVDTPEETGMYYQFNRPVGWSATDPLTAYDADGVIADAVWDSKEVLSYTWEPELDPCPSGWRVPDWPEFEKLWEQGKVTTVLEGAGNAVDGRRWTDNTTNETLFFPYNGYRSSSNGALKGVKRYGTYWLVDHGGINHGQILASSAPPEDALQLSTGYAVRCVAAE